MESVSLKAGSDRYWSIIFEPVIFREIIGRYVLEDFWICPEAKYLEKKEVIIIFTPVELLCPNLKSFHKIRIFFNSVHIPLTSFSYLSWCVGCNILRLSSNQKAYF